MFGPAVQTRLPFPSGRGQIIPKPENALPGQGFAPGAILTTLGFAGNAIANEVRDLFRQIAQSPELLRVATAATTQFADRIDRKS